MGILLQIYSESNSLLGYSLIQPTKNMRQLLDINKNQLQRQK